MEIIKNNKYLKFVLLVSLFAGSCSMQAFWPMGIMKKGFTALKSLGKSKKNSSFFKSNKKLFAGVGLAVGVLAVACLAFFKAKKYFGQSSLDNALLKACREGDLEEVKRLYEQGANLEYKKSRRSYNFQAIKTGFIFVDGSAESPMYNAVVNEHTDIIKFLLDNGVDVDSNVSGFDATYGMGTALWTAIYLNKFKSRKCLVENGADVNYNFPENYLVKAISLKNEKIAKYLIDNGAIINDTPLNNSENDSETLLDYWQELHGNEYEEGLLNVFKHGHEDDSLEKALSFYKLYKTDELEDIFENKDCPCCLKQIVLCILFKRYKQRDSLLLEIKDLEGFFASLPFNENFLKDLYKVKAIKFIHQYNITDKFNRNLVTACTGCKDKEVIDFVISNYCDLFGKIKKEDKVIFSSTDALKDLKKFLVSKDVVDTRPNKKSKFVELLEFAKKRNKKVYKKLLNRTYVYAKVGKRNLPDEALSKIEDFLFV